MGTCGRSRSSTLSTWWTESDEVLSQRSRSATLIAEADMTGVPQFMLSQAVVDQGSDSESDDEDFALTFSARSCKVVAEVSAPAEVVTCEPSAKKVKVQRSF